VALFGPGVADASDEIGPTERFGRSRGERYPLNLGFPGITLKGRIGLRGKSAYPFCEMKKRKKDWRGWERMLFVSIMLFGGFLLFYPQLR